METLVRKPKFRVETEKDRFIRKTFGEWKRHGVDILHPFLVCLVMTRFYSFLPCVYFENHRPCRLHE